MKQELIEKFKKIKIIFMDVDGVLNDGKAIFINGKSPKTWQVKDRLGIKILKYKSDTAIKIVWVSGRPSEELNERAAELGVDDAFAGVKDKYKVMRDILLKYNIDISDSMYIGDDLVDMICMKNSGISCCPKDAVREIKDISDYISEKSGGEGVVRDIIEVILKSRGVWDNIVANFKKDI